MELATRAVYRTQVTKLVNRATDYLKSPESKPINNAEKLSEIEEELITYIERVKSASDSLNKSNSEVKSLIKPDDFEKEFDSVAEYEDKSIHVLSRLKGRLDNIRREMQVPLSVIQPSTFQHADATAVRPSTSTHTAKLPTLSLRTFSGDIREWLPFWERFRTAVHDRNDLSGADKFNYLQNHLKGKAAESVSGYMPNEANYDACIALLQEEYGNNERLIEYTTSELMSFPRVSSSHDSIGLRKLYNHIVSNIRSLNSLGVAATKYSVILRTLLVKSFPPELATLFYRNHGQIAETGLRSVKDSDSDDISSVAQGSEPSLYCGDQRLNCVLTFLKREVEALERGGVFISRVQNRDRHVNKTTAGLFVSNETKHSYGSCFFCKSSSHTTEMCSASIPLTKRKDMLKSDGRCFKCTLGGHRSKMCRRKIECCACGGKHATSICDPAHRNVKKIATNNDSSTSSVPTHLTTTNLFSRSTDASTSFVYLQTAVVYLSSGADKSGCHLVRTILDGGSQRTYIKESTVKRLNLKAFDSVDIRIMAFGASEDAPIKPMNRVKIQIKSQFDNRRVWALAVVVPEICANILPVPNAENNGLNLVFADNYVRGVIEDEIGLLIGADVYWKVVKNENHVISDSLRAINTIFGWTLHGETNSGSNAKFSLSASVISLCACGQLQQDLDFERFWSLENIGIVPPTIESRQIPVKESISREGDRYMASLLWRSPDSHIHDYKNGAFLRFQRLTKRLSKDPATLKDYDQAMWELISNGIAETCNDDEKLRNQRTYYMAHHPVYRPEKSTTKTRIVFDASGKEGEHESLNELLSPGPNLMGDLLAILLNFRVGNIALVGDIEKAFLQIKLAPSDKDVHRFFWFKKPLDEQTTPQIATYRMCRLTFGVNCSPCLLSATLLKHLDTESTNFPETCQLLENSFYMDDLALSVDSYERASQCFNETSQILRRAGMNIRKWNSNEERLCEEFKHAGNITDMQKVLGIIWFSKNDRLAVDLEKVANSTPTNITKRSLLQFLAQIYDPLGILGPFILNLKLLFQETWRIKMSWDESLPCYLRTSWEKCVKGLPYLKNITLPRCIQSVRDPTTIQLHIFCDASPSAFGAVAYARVKSANGTIGTTFICSRNRLAPLPSEKKPRIPIPKMELTAATVAARLLKYITKSVKRSFDEVYLWTDSQITLSWILNGGRKAEPYVNNRVKQIRELFPTEIWRFCPGYQNPADLLTRETSARKLQRSTTWLSGPAWLSEDESQWPQIIPNSDMPENSVSLPIKDFTHLTKMDPVFDATRFSKYRKLLRVTAYLLRFVTLLRGKPNETISLNAKEIEAAEIYWIKNIQLNEFNREIDALRNKRSLHNSSTILKLTPKIDENGILRVSSRLSESDFSWGEINPIILPKNSHISSLIVSHIHEQTLHSGVNATLTKLRERFWIIKSRQLIKSTIYRCNVCRFLRCKPIAQPFAPLPKERLLSSKPFENTGIDFAGPLYVRDTTSIISTRKTYILLATCAVTRAVHLELVPDMTTESCILALRRFFARRGIPKLIMSDNAKTFKRASKELQFLNSWTSQEMQDFSSGQGISWKFIVERTPWWGGFWERLVKIVKDLLKATIRREVLTTEQLQTYLSEVEYIVNSRPLTNVGDDPLDLSPLTPANFLIGSFPGTLSAIKEGKDSDIRSKWKERLRLQQHLQKRFKTEYLQQLRSAHHNKQLFSKTIKVGNVVTYNDQFVPRHLWKLARVEQLFIGRDGRCGRNSPCEQLCYEIHYGMYECGCTEGYELDKNGYSCQEINSTFSSGADRGSREEDILYQKGVSFSAKLEGPSLSQQNPDEETGDDDSRPGLENSREAASSAEIRSDQSLLKSQIESIRDVSQAHSTSLNKPTMSTFTQIPQEVASTVMYSNGDDDNFYAKQDMSIYDDVNNNRLNIRPYRPDTYQIQVVEETTQTTTLNSAVSTTNSISLLPSGVQSGTNTTEPIVTTQPEPCTLDCGLEGVCENVDDSATPTSAIGIATITSNISTTGTATTSPMSDNGRMKCQCPFGKTGKGCLEDAKINIPRFTKKSWLAFPALRGAYKHVQLRVEFRPESFNGIILLTGERDDLTGDFMALLIHQGFIEFWFDCGSGTGSVRSKETVLLNQWNSVTIYRHRWDAWLVLNHETRVQGRSKGLFSRITFREPVFLGGTGNITGLAKRLPIYEGFVGCIRRFIANEHEYKFEEHPLGDVTKGFGIQDCTTDKCVKYPCQHGGKCLPSDQGAVCLCPLGYGGDLCEMRLDLQVPSFNGSSYLRYAPLGDSALIWLEIEIIIKAHRGDGLLLYSGHEDSGDFIALSLINGYVEFSFDLGSGLAFVRSRNPISFGQWHSVKVSRTARLAVLRVDQSEEVMTISPNGFWHLSLPHSLFLGGTHAMKKPLVGIKDQHASFVGCIQKVDINGRTLSIISEALGGTNVDNCPHACVARPCGPLAECVPLLDNYECRCSPYNLICNKAEEVSLKQTHNNSNNQNFDNSKSISNSDNFSTLKSKSEQHVSTRTHSKHAHHKKTHDTMAKHSNVQDYKLHWKHEKSSASKHHNSKKARKEPKKDVEQNDTEGDYFSQKTLAEDMNLPSEGTFDVNPADALLVDGYLTDYAAETSSQKSWHVKPTQAFHRSLPVGKATKSLKHETANFDGDEYLTSDAKLPFEEHAKEQIEDMDLNPVYLTLDDNDYNSNDNPDNGNFEKINDDILDDYVVEDNGGHDDNNFNDKVKTETIKIAHYNSRKHKKTGEQKDTLHRMQDDIDIDTDTNNLFDGEEDYRAKDFIRDMKRIMKNGNSGSTNDGSAGMMKTTADGPTVHHSHSKMVGTPNYKRTVGACFTGTDSYFHYNDAETMSHVISYKIDLNLRFKTRSKYGVILWSGRQSALDNDDFLSLGIENGYLHLRYNLGSGETNIQFNGTKVSDGLWHRVRATRKLQEGSLEVDGRKSVVQRSPGKLAQLNTDTGLYVGGMPNVGYYTRQRYYSGIVGCISEIVLAGEVQLTLDPATLGAAHNVEVGIL